MLDIQPGVDWEWLGFPVQTEVTTLHGLQHRFGEMPPPYSLLLVLVGSILHPIIYHMTSHVGAQHRLQPAAQFISMLVWDSFDSHGSEAG